MQAAFLNISGGQKWVVLKSSVERWMEWCKAHHLWTLEHRTPVLRSNKTRLSGWKYDKLVWVWQIPEEHCQFV